MEISSSNKNLLVRIIIIVSLVLVFTSILMIMFSQPDSYGGKIEWNSHTFILPPDSTYTVDDNSLTVNSSIKSYNIRVDKSNNLSDYNMYIANDVTAVTETSYNSTHKTLINRNSCYAAIISEEYIKDNPTSNPYIIGDNVEILEFGGEDDKYMSSFIASMY